MSIEKQMVNMTEKVREFQDKIIGIEQPTSPRQLSPERAKFRANHVIEEMREFLDAHEAGALDLQIDGLIDAAYLIFGTLLEMGINPETAFDPVHRANMMKERGVTQRSNGTFDAVKPEGWQPPDMARLVEELELRAKVSQVFVKLTALRIHKGANYNRGSVKRQDHFPLGHLSYFQMVWVKAIRLRSLVESISVGRTVEERVEMAENIGQDSETIRLIDRELNDLMAYACFWSEWANGINMEDK